jgi:hypothetical protein
MQLLDFRTGRLDRLRRRMNAPLIEKDWSWRWDGTDRDRLLEQLRSQEGVLLDDDLSGLVINPDLTFTYEGQRVLLYIRDQWYGPDREYKFHVAGCRTIDRMFSSGRRNRYVVTNNTTSEFKVVVRQGRSIRFEGTREMRVCKNCLDALNYRGYTRASSSQQRRIYSEFDLGDFFDRYEETTFPTLPDYDEHTAPANVYPPDFSRISMQYRRAQNWRCEQCGLDLRRHKKWLHVHHINHQRNDNRRSNLRALCLRCHAKQADHERLKNHPEYAEFLRHYPM